MQAATYITPQVCSNMFARSLEETGSLIAKKLFATSFEVSGGVGEVLLFWRLILFILMIENVKLTYIWVRSQDH